MKAEIKCDFDEGLRADVNVDSVKKVEVVIDVAILDSIKPIPEDTIRFFVTSQPEGDYNELIKNNPDCCDYLLTSFEYLLKLPNAYYFMGCTSFFEPDPNIPKEFGVSTVMSGRCNLPGHFLRRELWERRKEIKIPFDFYLGTHNKLPEHFYREGIVLPAEKKEKKRVFNRMYHIAIDSYRRNDFFSEKLIDCFITKTIPIYWGCPNIGKYFNQDGIYVVCNVDDVIWLFNNDIKENIYHEVHDVLEENYQLGLEYYNYGYRLEKTIKEVLNEKS